MTFKSDTIDTLYGVAERIVEGGSITEQEALELIPSVPVHVLFDVASTVREYFKGRKVDLCSIVNAKSGGCPEDCSFCAQSVRYRTDVKRYSLLDKQEILKHAKAAKDNGARRFCIVTSGRRVTREELVEIADSVAAIRDIGLLPCATLGILDLQDLRLLKDAGLYRYHHNLETSRSFFHNVCTTHSYEDKLNTVRAAMEAGLSTCSGGLFGIGESWADRVEMAFTLKELGVDSVPINFLIPIKGTPLGDRPTLNPLEALRIVSLFRLVLPDREIRVCGGRRQTLGHFNSMVFLAGADAILIGNYLTQQGCELEEDRQIISVYGLEPA